MRNPSILIAMVLGAASCGPGDPGAEPFAGGVADYAPSGSGGFGSERLPDVVLGPPQGGGTGAGSTDVCSLGCGGSIVVELGVRAVDGPGPDLIVFENAFETGAGGVFAEPGEVSVSADGVEWRTFECVLDGEPALAGCAGVTPVLANPDNGLDPTDPAVAGGDAFDLADVGLPAARFVRILDRTGDYYGSTPWCTAPKGGFDLDAVSVVNGG
jgi:hypothetical protein